MSARREFPDRRDARPQGHATRKLDRGSAHRAASRGCAVMARPGRAPIVALCEREAAHCRLREPQSIREYDFVAPCPTAPPHPTRIPTRVAVLEEIASVSSAADWTISCTTQLRSATERFVRFKAVCASREVAKAELLFAKAPSRERRVQTLTGAILKTCAWPPSTKSSAPTTKLASPEKPERQPPWRSRPSATRPIGTWVAM